jgi:plasmid stabilization system protein ParE
MVYDLEIKESANLEVVEAYHYYEDLSLGLGEKFLDHLSDYLDRIIRYPKHFPQKRKPYREAFLKRFPYIIIYEITDKTVVVYSVFHANLNPSKKP